MGEGWGGWSKRCRGEVNAELAGPVEGASAYMLQNAMGRTGIVLYGALNEGIKCQSVGVAFHMAAEGQLRNDTLVCVFGRARKFHHQAYSRSFGCSTLAG